MLVNSHPTNDPAATRRTPRREKGRRRKRRRRRIMHGPKLKRR